jgi:hypothetical protein
MSNVRVNTILDAAGGNTATINGMTPTAQSLQGFRNRIINGNMVISQRNGTSVVTPADNDYTLDRWRLPLSQPSKLTVQQSTTAPIGFSNSALITSTSAYSVGASEGFLFSQRIEGFNFADMAWGTASANTVTLSFWVRSSLTGTFGGSLSNSANNRWYAFSYTINAANTWEQKSVTITGDTSGTWVGATNGTGLNIYFSVGSGSSVNGTAGSWGSSALYSVTGSTNVVGTNGATWFLTGVQLEAGSVATPFERRDYGRELMMCQRYCTTAGGASLAQGAQTGTTNAEFNFVFPVTMRASPSMSFPTTSDFSVFSWVALAGRTATSVSLLNSSVRKGTVSIGWSSALGGAGQVVSSDNGASFLTFSAEL